MIRVTRFLTPARGRTVHVVVALVASMPLVALLGCGGGDARRPTAHLRGAVTLGGEALPEDAEANLFFKPTARGQARTTSVPVVDGVYDAPDVPLGTVKLYFDLQRPTGRMVSEAGGTPFPEYRNLVPAEYGNGLEIQVDGDSLERDFDL